MVHRVRALMCNRHVPIPPPSNAWYDKAPIGQSPQNIRNATLRSAPGSRPEQRKPSLYAQLELVQAAHESRARPSQPATIDHRAPLMLSCSTWAISWIVLGEDILEPVSMETEFWSAMPCLECIHHVLNKHHVLNGHEQTRMGTGEGEGEGERSENGTG